MYAASLSWWSTSDADFRMFRREFAQLVSQYDVPLLWRCLSALYGREFDDVTPSPELHDALAALILASDCTDPERGRVLARQAVAVADLGNDIALRVGTRFVQAMRNQGASDASFEEALTLAGQLASSVMRESLEAYRAGISPIGFFQSIVDHLERSGHVPLELRVTDTARNVPVSRAERVLVVDLAAGEVLRGGEPVRTSEGTTQLLMLLAVHHGTNRDVLTDTLWPDLDGDAAANALKACIHRARTQLDDSEVIVVSKSTYRLGPDVHSTYEEILGTAATTGPLSDGMRAEFLELFDRLSKGLAANRLPWDWFVPYAREMTDAMRTLGEKLGKEALDRGDVHTALQVARRLAGVDPFDEASRELVLRAYARLGNRTAALREYEEFSEKLRRELGAAPSERLRRLVTSP
jgi:DNA-binding SARP family transcriptional activator